MLKQDTTQTKNNIVIKKDDRKLGKQSKLSSKNPNPKLNVKGIGISVGKKRLI